MTDPPAITPQHVGDPPAITQVGTTVVIAGAAIPLLYRSVFALWLRQHRDGIAPTPLLIELTQVLYRASVELQMSAHGHKDATPTPAGPSCTGQDDEDWIGTAEVAELLGVSERQARRLASGLEGVRVGSIWVTRRSSVLALAERRGQR